MVGPRKPASVSPIATDRLATSLCLLYSALIGLAGVVAAMSAGAGIGLMGDSVEYLSSARAFVTGHGLRAVAGAERPPGLGILLWPLCLRDSLPLRSARILMALAAVAIVTLAFALMRMRVGPRLALLVAGLVATNALLFEHSCYLLSELPFTTLALGALVIFERWRLDRVSPRSWSLLSGTVLTAAAAIVRVAGLALVPVGMLAIGAHRSSSARWRLRAAMIFACVASAPSLAWVFRYAGHERPGSYLSQMAHPRDAPGGAELGPVLTIERVVRLLPQRLVELAQSLLPRSIAWRLWTDELRWVAGGVGVAIVIALVLTAFRDRGGPAIFALLSWVVLLVWPWDEGPRFVVPLVPVVTGIIVESASRLGSRCARGIPARAALASAAVVAVAAQACELVLTASRLPAMQARFATRLERGRAVSDVLRALPPEWSIMALLPQGEDAKVDLALGAYLAERHVEIVDCDAKAEIPQPRHDVLVTHRHVPSGWAMSWAYQPIGAVQEFILWRPAARRWLRESQSATAPAGFPPPFFSILAHVSFSDTARLKTSAPGRESGSTQKYPRRSNW